MFSLINESFLKNENNIFFCLLWLSGLTNYFSVYVLSGALSSSNYFCLLFFLHLSLTLYFFCIFLG